MINNSKVNGESFVSNWVYDEKPILVIKGIGGIGKTTLSKRLCDEFTKSDNTVNVLFINSNEIISELRKAYEREGRFDLYVFYEASCRSQENNNEILDREIFKHNLRNGKILIILDGLDEVFAKINSSFNIKELLQSINEYNGDTGRGKIIITCRDYFWNEDSNSDEQTLELIEVLPFDKELSQGYFDKYFPRNDKKIAKCNLLAKELSQNNDEQKIELSPYFVHMICKIIEDEDSLDHSFSSDLLDHSHKIDKIIFRLLKREAKKLGQIDVDSQIRFFMRLTSLYDGVIKEEKIDDLLKSISHNISDQSIEAFKAHPLLMQRPGIFRFRYDFNESFFKALYLSSTLKSQAIEVDNQLLPLLSLCSFTSELTKDTAKRSNYDDMLILNAIEIIDRIVSKSKNDNLLLNKNLSGLFSVCLKILHTNRSNTKEANTSLIQDMFSNSNNEISSLHINSIAEVERILFSFKGKHFTNTVIDGYQSFWECDFDEKTFFDETCIIKNIDIPSTNANRSIERRNFHPNIQHDGCIDDVFGKQTENKYKKQEKIVDMLEKVFKLFTRGSQFCKRAEEFLKPQFGRKNNIRAIKYDDVLDVLEEENIVERTKDNYVFWQILANKENDIVRFNQEGTPSKEINNVIGKLMEY